jgi:hypothetical protein
MSAKMGNKVEKFEDLIAWQKARELTLKIYQISRKGEFGKDYRLSGQIQGAFASVPLPFVSLSVGLSMLVFPVTVT